MQTTATFDDGTTARISYFKDLGHALYTIGDDTIHVMPTYLGQPDRQAVTISLGRPGDTSGYRLTGLNIGDYLLTGTVMCTGDGLTPHPHPHSPKQFPLDDITDADARQDAADYLSDIANHFYDTLA
ncbi:hypothetical protein PV516_19120 [Streptomyces scabiei]|uniref:hypothetical protein n=1 Tax=Streptomyces scabiei TaxID=1930 RepID=UPI0029A2E6E7|nr:hypothetical protein [Streptomyces scabiei]MDX3165900.1 hypothetical protein [Streptomyces scabiei]